MKRSLSGPKRGRKRKAVRQGGSRARRRLFKKTRAKRSRRSRVRQRGKRAAGGLKSNGFSTTNSFGSRRKLKKWMRPLVAGLKLSNNVSTYVYRSSLSSAKNQQATMQWATYSMSGGVPTVDPGTAPADFVRKIWWDQTGTSIGNTTRPVLHLGCDNQWTFRSCSETPIQLTIHHLIARRDHNQDPITLWNAGLVDTFKQYTDTYALTNPQNTTLGITPFQSTPFCQHFKVIGTRRVTLAPGEMHTTYVKQKAMKLIDAQMLKNSDYRYRKGLTYGFMFTIKGMVSNDLEGDVGIPPVKINYEVKQNYKWKLVNELNRDQLYYFDNSVVQTAVGTFREINPETGQIDTGIQNA